MHKFSQLSVKVKVLVLVVYTVALATLIVLLNVLFQPAIDANYQDYATTPYDENLMVTLKKREKRYIPSTDDADKNKEHSFWDVFMYLTKKDSSAMVVNVHGFLTAVTAEGNLLYKEGKASTWSNTSASFASWSNLGKTSNDYDEKTEEYSKLDNKPIKLYVSIYYEIRNNETGKSDFKNFTYQVEALDLDNIEFDSFEERLIDNETAGKKGYLVNEGELFDLRIERRVSGETSDRIRTYLTAKSIDGISMKHMIVEIYAQVANHPTDTEEYFSDYLLIDSYYGCVNQSTIMPSTNYVEINKIYNISKIYVIAKVLGSDNQEIITKAWVDYQKIKTY
ncbi:MAG TPA: hypothetical protein GXZ57_03215 [Acholeplasmataceae bacterium]|jgi:hypothetical protein|nr:hypothetical protein [Acholeplasmataceae bacterium]